MRTRMEQKRKEALWDLFQSESTFLRDHLMAIKNVSARNPFDFQNYFGSYSGFHGTLEESSS